MTAPIDFGRSICQLMEPNHAFGCTMSTAEAIWSEVQRLVHIGVIRKCWTATLATVVRRRFSTVRLFAVIRIRD